MAASDIKHISDLQFYETGNPGDIEHREILENYLDIRDEGDADIVEILEGTGAYKKTENKTFYNYSNDWLYNKAVVDTGGGGTITGGTSGTVTVVDASKVRTGEQLLTGTGAIGYVQSKSGNDLTVWAVDTLTIADADEVTFPSNGIAEGSQGVNNPVVDLIQKKNQVQIFESGHAETDLRKAAKVVLQAPNGQNYFYYKAEQELRLKHKADVANAFMVSKFATAQDANSEDVLMTRGLNSYVIDEGGVDDSTASAGIVTKADFKAYNRLLDLSRAPKYGHLWCGADIGNEIDDLFDTQLAAGAVDYGKFGKGDEAAKRVSLGINQFEIYGRTFEKSNLKCLDHPNVTAAAGFEWPNYAYFAPIGKIKGSAGAMVNRIQGRYLEVPDVNSRFHPKLTGGLAPVPTDKRNVIEFSITSWEGLEVNGPQQFGRLAM